MGGREREWTPNRFAGDNPTPDQSLVEEKMRSAIGVSYEDNEEFESFSIRLRSVIENGSNSEESSKSTDDMI
jgi:hypothetical protein